MFGAEFAALQEAGLGVGPLLRNGRGGFDCQRVDKSCNFGRLPGAHKADSSR